ncbi:hypothetical protein PQBR44_0166 (plasmid) [Pseudomonas putida UWC1]|uniref:hypothetical protein n=1 Tax=Pseudomonas fluorescens TaxID=294 RepID=UPI00065A3327|nr:hypothetical protein [Pseudomonas fluorescens]CEK42689.1 hypothetical protein PQBR44_0166 [Pseudomonas putida UWC1]
MADESATTWMNTYSMPVVPKGERYVKLSGLAEKYKREAWGQISSTNPALAQLLKEPELREAIKFFDADLFVEASSAPCLPVESLKGRKRAES